MMSSASSNQPHPEILEYFNNANTLKAAVIVDREKFSKKSSAGFQLALVVCRCPLVTRSLISD